MNKNINMKKKNKKPDSSFLKEKKKKVNSTSEYMKLY